MMASHPDFVFNIYGYGFAHRIEGRAPVEIIQTLGYSSIKWEDRLRKIRKHESDPFSQGSPEDVPPKSNRDWEEKPALVVGLSLLGLPVHHVNEVGGLHKIKGGSLLRLKEVGFGRPHPDYNLEREIENWGYETRKVVVQCSSTTKESRFGVIVDNDGGVHTAYNITRKLVFFFPEYRDGGDSVVKRQSNWTALVEAALRGLSQDRMVQGHARVVHVIDDDDEEEESGHIDRAFDSQPVQLQEDEEMGIVNDYTISQVAPRTLDGSKPWPQVELSDRDRIPRLIQYLEFSTLDLADATTLLNDEVQKIWPNVNFSATKIFYLHLGVQEKLRRGEAGLNAGSINFVGAFLAIGCKTMKDRKLCSKVDKDYFASIVDEVLEILDLVDIFVPKMRPGVGELAGGGEGTSSARTDAREKRAVKTTRKDTLPAKKAKKNKVVIELD